jgi:hypothetical protein
MYRAFLYIQIIAVKDKATQRGVTWSILGVLEFA